MATAQHTRTTGKRLTYDIQTDRNGTYTISLAGKVLRVHHDPLVVVHMRRPSKKLEAEAVELARGTIELLNGMPEE